MLSVQSFNTRLVGGLAFLSILASGCVDPAQAFDDFVERYPPLQPSGECPDAYLSPVASEFEGLYLHSLSTSLAPDKPIVFLATVTAQPALNGVSLTINYQPLNKMDRKTPVGDNRTFDPFDTGEDGSFTTSLIDVVVPPEGNSISPVTATANVNYQGYVCGDASFWCGDAEGTANALGTDYDLAGSTFTFQRITDEANYPPPVLDCKGTPAGM